MPKSLMNKRAHDVGTQDRRKSSTLRRFRFQLANCTFRRHFSNFLWRFNIENFVAKRRTDCLPAVGENSFLLRCYPNSQPQIQLILLDMGPITVYEMISPRQVKI